MNARTQRPARVLGVMVGVMLSMAATGAVWAAPASAQPSCTGQLVPDTAQQIVPFGREVVQPTVSSVDNFGLVVIRPEATAPHDDCP